MKNKFSLLLAFDNDFILAFISVILELEFIPNNIAILFLFVFVTPLSFSFS